MKRPKLLDKFLKSPNGELEVLITRARQLQHLQHQYQQTAPVNLAKNCQVANLQNQVLTLSCQSAAWATRAKMEKRQLLADLRELDAFSHLCEIEFITHPKSQPTEKKEKIYKIPMSNESAHTISEMADSIVDQDLSAALQRLARHNNDKARE